MPDGCDLRITKSTPVASMGSCFAREVKNVLVREGFSYINEEGFPPGCSACQRSVGASLIGKIQDPYRRIVLYDDPDQAETDFRNHKKCSRKALEQAEVSSILTLGLTEIWEDTIDGSVICLPSGLL